MEYWLSHLLLLLHQSWSIQSGNGNIYVSKNLFYYHPNTNFMMDKNICTIFKLWVYLLWNWWFFLLCRLVITWKNFFSSLYARWQQKLYNTMYIKQGWIHFWWGKIRRVVFFLDFLRLFKKSTKVFELDCFIFLIGQKGIHSNTF